MKPRVLRLLPGQDLKSEIGLFAKRMNLSAAFVVSCCGSLTKLKMRLADSTLFLEKSEKFEILSLQGTISGDGVHLHMSVSDKDGKSWGGHLVDGCEIYTTAEILVLELPEFIFSREMDPQTGFAELLVKKSR